MANYPVPRGNVAANDKTLTANAPDNVTFADTCQAIEVLTDGTAAVYFTVNGTVPSVSGQNCYKIPAGSTPMALTVQPPSAQVTQVQLISAGSPVYSVTRSA